MPGLSFDCDLCVIGGGEAGFAAAQGGVALGLAVTLIDSAATEPCWRNWDVGLAVLRRVSARGTREADAFGRFQSALDRALQAAAPDRRFARLAAMNIRVIRGRARFTGVDRVEVEGQTVRARRFVLATGTRPPEDHRSCFSHSSLVQRLRAGPAPAAFHALGGDERSVALALGLARVGIRASLRAPGGLLPKHDPELVGPIRRALQASGVDLIEAEPADDKTPPDGVFIYAPASEPAIASLDPAAANLDVRDGALRLSAALRTTNPRVYAIGGVAGARSSQATQTQVGVVLRSAFFRLPALYAPAGVPRCVEACPGLATVGLNESTAGAAGPVTVWRWPLAETAAGVAWSVEGFVKIVADRRGTILGAGVVGPEAVEQIGLWTMAVRDRMSLAEIATLPLPSPALAEASRRAASQFLAHKLRSPWTKRALSLLGRFG